MIGKVNYMRRIAAHVDENPFFLRENGEGSASDRTSGCARRFGAFARRAIRKCVFLLR